MRVAPLTASATAVAMVAFPVARRGGRARRTLTHVVIGGLGATTSATAARRWGAGRTAAATVAVTATTWALERIGTATGIPFGRYRYTDRLPARVAGVPLVVPVAWWAMALPAREAAHAALGGRTTPVLRVAVGAAALTAWDVFLDPQMTAEGYWRWIRRGAYRGIPLINYAGWLVAGAAVMALLEIVLPPRRPDPVLVAEYAGMGVMETIGFAAFFRDPLVATAGALAMVPLSAAAVWGVRG